MVDSIWLDVFFPLIWFGFRLGFDWLDVISSLIWERSFFLVYVGSEAIFYPIFTIDISSQTKKIHTKKVAEILPL